jgi:glycosyltransferase involved in cell wall biosynthesis
VRICAVTSFPPSASGVADYGQLVVAELARHPRVDALTVLADGSGAVPDDPSGAIEVRRTWTRDRVIAPTVLAEIGRSRPDVVWFNFGLTMFGTRPVALATGLMLPLAARILGHRVVVTVHELPALADLASLGFGRVRGCIGGWAAMRALLGADDVVVTLDRYRRHLQRRHAARNVTHIPHGLWSRPDAVAEDDGRTVLVFGTFGPHKDPRLVAEAVRRIRRSGRDVRLIVAGTDHPRYPGFMAARRAMLGRDDVWAGYVPGAALAPLFARAALVAVAPTASTGSSGVIHRAIGHGRAVVVSDLPDFRALAEEEELALSWSSPGSVDGLASAIEGLLADREMRRRLVAHNMRATARLSPERTADAYVRVFREGARRPAVVTTAGVGRVPRRIEA